jgi:hypothetical protein
MCLLTSYDNFGTDSDRLSGAGNHFNVHVTKREFNGRDERKEKGIWGCGGGKSLVGG